MAGTDRGDGVVRGSWRHLKRPYLKGRYGNLLDVASQFICDVFVRDELGRYKLVMWGQVCSIGL